MGEQGENENRCHEFNSTFTFQMQIRPWHTNDLKFVAVIEHFPAKICYFYAFQITALEYFQHYCKRLRGLLSAAMDPMNFFIPIIIRITFFFSSFSDKAPGQSMKT